MRKDDPITTALLDRVMEVFNTRMVNVRRVVIVRLVDQLKTTESRDTRTHIMRLMF